MTKTAAVYTVASDSSTAGQELGQQIMATFGGSDLMLWWYSRHPGSTTRPSSMH